MSNNETSRWHFVRMEEELNNKGKKISASTCISHFLSFEVVSAPMSCSLDDICPFLSIGLLNERLLRMSRDALL